MVSVVLPNYNHAAFLEKRIESILFQTYTDFELIILDNCSTDKSREIIEKYHQHPNVSKIIYNDHNNGNTFKQWNKGVALAKGSYVWIAESDDVAEPDFLKKLVLPLENDRGIVMAYSSSRQVDQFDNDVNVLGVHVTPYEYFDIFKKDFIISGKDFLSKYMCISNYVPNASAVLFRRDVFLKTGMADEGKVLMGDWLQWARLMAEGKVYYTHEVLNIFRTHPGTNRARIKLKIHLLEYIGVQEFIVQHANNDLATRQYILDAFCYRVKKAYFLKKGIGISGFTAINKYLKNFPAKACRKYFLKSLFTRN